MSLVAHTHTHTEEYARGTDRGWIAEKQGLWINAGDELDWIK